MCPKPLFPIYGKPLITFALDHLIDAGVERFVINTHHLAGKFEEAFGSRNYRGRPMTLLHEPDLLETGGGIKNAEPWIDAETFVVYSGDVLTDLDVGPVIEEHFRSRNDVTLALRRTGLASGISLHEGRIGSIRAGHQEPGGWDYANVSVWNRSAFEKFEAGRKVSFIPVLAKWIGDGGRIGGVVTNDRGWFNIGSRTEYLAVHKRILEQHWRPGFVHGQAWPEWRPPSADIAKTARLAGFYSIGEHCVIEDDVLIEDTVIWPGATVRSGSHLRDCVVGGSLVISGVHDSVDLMEPV